MRINSNNSNNIKKIPSAAMMVRREVQLGLPRSVFSTPSSSSSLASSAVRKSARMVSEELEHLKVVKNRLKTWRCKFTKMQKAQASEQIALMGDNPAKAFKAKELVQPLHEDQTEICMDMSPREVGGILSPAERFSFFTEEEIKSMHVSLWEDSTEGFKDGRSKGEVLDIILWVEGEDAPRSATPEAFSFDACCRIMGYDTHEMRIAYRGYYPLHVARKVSNIEAIQEKKLYG